MSTFPDKSYPFSGIVKKVLEGRISPLNFMIMLGFFSTLILFYISLHVHFLSMAADIRDCRERLLMMRDQNARLTTRYNEMISPSRIIPAARQLGLKAGKHGEIIRFALYGGKEGDDDNSSRSYASIAPADSLGNFKSPGVK